MKFLERHIGEKIITQNLIIFYAVGIALYYIPFTRELFFFILPFQLLSVNGILFYYHTRWNAKTIAVLLFIFISSWLVEYIGVTFGQLFGKYQYLSSLGIKIRGVPVLIGLNWVMLAYASNALIRYFSDSKLIRIIVSALIMVTYDLILEFTAADLRMWKFSSDFPPVRNFISWLVLALIYNAIIELFNINTENKAARAIISIQFVFFTGILALNFILSL